MMTIISVMIISPISPLTSILPLSFVVFVTACKQGYEDYNRYMADKRINRTFITVIRNKCIQVGAILLAYLKKLVRYGGMIEERRV